MSGYGYSADERPLVKHVPDLDLAYILQRYKEIHDANHVLLNYGTSVSEEIAVKWFEMIQTGLPLPALSAFVGPLNVIANREGTELWTTYLPHIMRNRNATFFMNEYFEERFEMKITDLRKRMGIVPLTPQL